VQVWRGVNPPAKMNAQHAACCLTSGTYISSAEAYNYINPEKKKLFR